MKKDLNEFLKMVNEEGWNAQFYWETKEDAEKDLQEYFQCDEIDNTFVGEGEYVFNIIDNVYLLKEAIEIEIEGSAYYNFEHFNPKERENIIDFIKEYDEEYGTAYYSKFYNEYDYIIDNDFQDITAILEGDMPF